jgi:hypothetical protein
MGFQGISFVAKRHQATTFAARADPDEIKLPAILRKSGKVGLAGSACASCNPMKHRHSIFLKSRIALLPLTTQQSD